MSRPPRLIPALALVLGPALALAQDHRALEEVVVTAQKKSEILQDVPISISAVTAQDLADVNIFNFSETTDLTPGVTLGIPGLQSAAIRIRGVGAEFFSSGTPQSVSVFVDEVAQAEIGAVFSTLVDVERIELLRGPQSTLYGQNSPGGAYNITTVAPGTEGVEGYVEGSYSAFDASDLDRSDVRGAVNLPLVDDVLAWRLAGVYVDSAGYVKMKNPDRTESTSGGTNQKAVRSRLLWNATPDMDLLWTSNYKDIKDHGAGFNYDGLVPGSGGTNPVAAEYNQFKDRHSYASFPSEVTGKIKDTSLHWRWDTGLFDVDFLASYQDFETVSDEDRAPYFNGVGLFNIDSDTDINTFELRLSDSGDLLDYIAGLYYADQDQKSNLNILITEVEVFGDAKGTNKSQSAFTNVTWHLAGQWDLSTGLRYDDNDVSLVSNLGFLDFRANVDESQSFDHVSWSVKLRYYHDENTTLYAAVDDGYKQGGFNPLVAGVLPFADIFPDVVAVAENTLSYDPETSTAYEVGIKGSALDNRMSYSLAVFYQQFDDHQIAQPNTDTLEPLDSLFLQAIVNAGEVATQGVEFELHYLLGDNWDAGLRGAYFDPTIKKWDNRFCPVGQATSPDQVYCPAGSGDPLNTLPQWNTNVQLGYVQPLDTGWEIYARLDWTWQSGPNFTTLTDQFDGDRSKLGGSLGFRDNERGIDLRFWAKNLTNEDYNYDPTFLEANGDPNLPPAFRGEFYPGREFGLTARYSF